MINLYKINDILNESFIRLPLALIANPMYRRLSSDAKILYSLLCNRLRLSQINNWVNEEGEVYLIYTREQASETLGISYKTVIKTFRELIEIGLLYEERRGKSLANHLYLSKPEECNEKETSDFNNTYDKPFTSAKTKSTSTVTCKNDISNKEKDVGNSETPQSDMSNLHIKTCKNDSSEHVKSTVLDMSNLHTSKKDIIKKNLSEIDKSPPVSLSRENTDNVSDKLILEKIIENCEFEIFDENARNIYISAVERLYYSQSYKLDNSILPQSVIRQYLERLNAEIFFMVNQSLNKISQKLKNPIGYVMSMIINAVCENNFELIAYNPGFIFSRL